MAKGKVEIDVTADTGEARKKIERLGDEAEAAGDAAKKSGKDAFGGLGKGSDDAKDKVDELVGSIKAVGTAVGIGAAVSAVGSLASEAAETLSAMSRLSAAAERNGVSAAAMQETYSGLVGVLGETDRSVETAGNMFALCGDNEAELEELTTALTGAFSQFGDSLPIEGLAEAANETAKVGQVTGSFADALNWVNASTDEWNAALSENPAAMAAFNEAVEQGASKEDAFNAALCSCTGEQERQQLVLSTLNGLYGEAGAAYEQNNAGLIAYNQSQDNLNQAMAELGEALLPLVTSVLELGAAIAEGLAPYVEPVAQALGDLVDNALQWLLDNLPGLLPWVVGIGTAFLTWQVVATVSSVLSSLPGILAMVSGAMAMLNAVMMANPFVLIAALIAGVVAGLIALWNTNEGFRNAVSEIWAAITGFFSNAVNGIVGFITGTLIPGIQGFPAFMASLPGTIGGFLANVVGRVASWVGEMAGKAAQAASEFGSSLMSGLASLPGRVASIGSDIIGGIVRGITGAAGSVVSAVTGAVGGAIEAAKSFLGIASPSKRFRDEVGRWIPEGAAAGVDKRAGVLADSVRAMSEAALGAARVDVSAPDVAYSVVGAHSAPQDLTPVVDAIGSLEGRLRVLQGRLGTIIAENAPRFPGDRDMGRLVRSYVS